jgi:hypothetical protein
MAEKYSSTHPLYEFYQEGWSFGYQEAYGYEMEGWEEDESVRMEIESRQKIWNEEQLKAFEEGILEGSYEGARDV